MAGVKINKATVASALGGTEDVPMVQNGQLVRSTPSAIATYVGANLPVITSVGTILTGVWNGTVIGPAYGGSGFTSYAAGEMIYATGATSLAKLSVGTSGQVITSTGAVPSWQYPRIVTRQIAADTTLALTDGGGGIYHARTDATARTVTIPTAAAVAFPVGTVISIYNGPGAGALSVSPSPGVVLEFPPNSGSGQRTIAASGLATLWLVSSGTWVISGVGVS